MENRGETGTILLGTEMNLEEITTKSSTGMKTTGGQKLAGRVGPHRGERSSLGTGTTVILMLKTTPEAIWYRAKSIALDRIVRTKLVPQWLQGQFASAKGFDLPLFRLTSG